MRRWGDLPVPGGVGVLSIVGRIEIWYKSSVYCPFANISLSAGRRVGWDEAKNTIVEPDLKKWIRREKRAP